MKPLQLKFNLLILLLTCLSIGATILGYKDYKKIKKSQNEIISIISLRETVDQLNKKDPTDQYIRDLQTIRASIINEKRQTLFSDIIQAYNSKNTSLLNKRIHALLIYDETYYKTLKSHLDLYEKQSLFHAMAVLTLFLLTISFLKGYLKLNIFDPIKMTTERMIDFLNGKYSYYFGTPPENELGELQSAFNSMAQEVLKNLEELKALDAAKSDFLNIASHELRTPMTSIKGSLSLVNSGVMGLVEHDVLQLLKIAEAETDRLIRLINDILDMAKIDARKLPLKQEWVLLSDIIQKTNLSLQGLSQTFNVPIALKNIPDVYIFADADRIQQVLTNLLSNAIKYSPIQKSVEILVDAQLGQPIKIMVRDHGRGMTPQEKGILFQKFRQITSPDNPLVKGTGLGLAIAKALVEEHQGIIDVSTTPNEGSTFFFTLPNWKLISNNIDTSQNTAA